eukprot:3125722-Amphidinium_carterae.1
MGSRLRVWAAGWGTTCQWLVLALRSAIDGREGGASSLNFCSIVQNRSAFVQKPSVQGERRVEWTCRDSDLHRNAYICNHTRTALNERTRTVLNLLSVKTAGQNTVTTTTVELGTKYYNALLSGYASQHFKTAGKDGLFFNHATQQLAAS